LGRRDFLREGLLAVAALTAIAGSAAPLHALSRTYVTGQRKDDTVTYPLPAADGATIDGANKVILVRYMGEVSAFSIKCPHKQTTLEWQPEKERFYCPKHKSTFKPEGTLIQGKAKRNMDRFAVRLDGANLVVDRAVLVKSDDDAAAWEAAVVRVK
ncbi:MAG: QcrA and Rieske domain-containing protein, partial [Gemmatimonadaceae bacterium]